MTGIGSESPATLIRNGLVVTPTETSMLDIIVRDGRIAALMAPSPEPACEVDIVVDLSGMVVLPGAIDGHTHFVQNEHESLSAEDAEGFEAGGRGAAAGGVTTVVEMPQAEPSTTDGRTFRRKRELAERHAIVDFALWGGVVPGQAPEAIHEQASEGAVGFKAFLCNSDPALPAIDDAQLLASLNVVKGLGRMLGLHAESESLLQAGLAAMARAGTGDPMAHAESRPPSGRDRGGQPRGPVCRRHPSARPHRSPEQRRRGRCRRGRQGPRGRKHVRDCPHYLTLDH